MSAEQGGRRLPRDADAALGAYVRVQLARAERAHRAPGGCTCGGERPCPLPLSARLAFLRAIVAEAEGAP